MRERGVGRRVPVIVVGTICSSGTVAYLLTALRKGLRWPSREREPSP